MFPALLVEEVQTSSVIHPDPDQHLGHHRQQGYNVVSLRYSARYIWHTFQANRVSLEYKQRE
jgi:hypothetical protein